MIQWVKLSLVTPASHIKVLVPNPHDPLPANASAKAVKDNPSPWVLDPHVGDLNE